jgi:hypothetical protein
MQPIMQIALPVFMARNLTASPLEIKGLVTLPGGYGKGRPVQAARSGQEARNFWWQAPQRPPMVLIDSPYTAASPLSAAAFIAVAASTAVVK